MNGRRKSEIGDEDRKEIFHETFDFEIDAGATLAQLVRATGEYLGIVVGREDADAAMARVVSPLAGHDVAAEEWREQLQENEANCSAEWPIGQRLHDLAAYAYYGITLDGDGRENPAAWIKVLVEEAVSFLERSRLWLGPDQVPQLERLVMLAEARWALDNNRPVKPSAVAEFGGISAPRMRNLMAGAERVFNRDAEGLIPAHEALAWLVDRESFWTSVWREQPLPMHRVRDRPSLEEPVFVPVARDGSVFHPGLERAGSYTIGEKGDEKHVETFDAALRALQAMPEPYWRRPSDKGAWGLVRGVRWERLDREDLRSFAANRSSGSSRRPDQLQ